MPHHAPPFAVIAILGALAAFPVALRAAPTVRVPAAIDHAAWDGLLQRRVDERGLVDYAGWLASADDVRALDVYLAHYARTDAAAATGDEEIAALINAYNACTIRWILKNYPTESIRQTDDAWSAARWDVGGRIVSLDEIEHQNLRPLYGWKVHATIVCAARSCPPLQRAAYSAENLATLTAQAYRAWLTRPELNRYTPARDEVELSPIFKWFKEDFTGDGALAKILEQFGPVEHRAFFAAAKFDVDYLDYHWGLNDQSGRGEKYKHGWF